MKTYRDVYVRPASLFTPVKCTYGAPMGRPDISDYLRGEEDIPRRFRVVRIRWTNGCYDQGGAYWGSGMPVYLAVFNGMTLPPGDTEPTEEYIRRSYRARNRAEAIRMLREEFPNARTR